MVIVNGDWDYLAPILIIYCKTMNWIKSGTWEIFGVIAATLVLAFQLFPLFSPKNKGFENYPESNSLGNLEGLFIGLKNNKWRLIGVVIIAVSLIAGITQKSILFGLSICATLNFLLSVIDKSYVVSAAGSNRFVANLVVGFYSSGTFLLMILFWFLLSKFK